MASSNLTLSQSVTVTVQQINELSIVGDVNLTISSSNPGGGLNPAVDGSSATYNLTTNDSGKKIIGSIDAPYSTGIRLFILLGAPAGGSISSEEELTATDIDLVTGIGYAVQTGLTIQYTADVSVNAAPNGAGETRTVTLTLMDN